ncbi:peroxidase 21-like [Nymphaea colorata]|nr:peroxidase 21-like [Nymphaea colorata]
MAGSAHSAFTATRWPLTLFLVVLVSGLLCSAASGPDLLQLNYYSQSCPKAEEIIRDQVDKLYQEHGNTAVSWIRNLFHDCMVESCDASLLLETSGSIVSEKTSSRSFGMRNFKYVDVIKQAVESACPGVVSCADVIALSARDGIVKLGGPYLAMKTGRRDSRQSYAAVVEEQIPNHNDSLELVLSRFQSIGVDVEGTVALLGAHSVGRVHCVNLVNRLYPEVDSIMNPEYGQYLRKRCPSPTPDLNAVVYARNDRETPMILDNMYYKNVLNHKALLLVDEELIYNNVTLQYVQKMAMDNNYFREQFSRALLIMSEHNPLTGNEGEIRKDCRFINKN